MKFSSNFKCNLPWNRPLLYCLQLPHCMWYWRIIDNAIMRPGCNCPICSIQLDCIGQLFLNTHLSKPFFTISKKDPCFKVYVAIDKLIWWLWCQQQVSHAWISNCIPQNTVGSNYLGPCLRYLVLVSKSSYIVTKHNILPTCNAVTFLYSNIPAYMYAEIGYKIFPFCFCLICLLIF